MQIAYVRIEETAGYLGIGFKAGAAPAGSGVRPTLSAMEMSRQAVHADQVHYALLAKSRESADFMRSLAAGRSAPGRTRR